MVVAAAIVAASATGNPHGGRVRIPAILVLLTTFLALPITALADEVDGAESSEDSASDEDAGATTASPEAPAAEPETQDPQAESADSKEAEQQREAAEGGTKEAVGKSEPAPEGHATGELTPAEDENATAAPPESTALQGLRHALDQVAALQLLLAEGHEGEGPVRGQSELGNVRRALENALVEVARLEQDLSLRQWLEGEGLKAALAEVDRAAVDAPVTEQLTAEDGHEAVVAIEEVALRGVKRAIEDAPFKEGKMQVLTDQLQEFHLRTEQVGELIELFTFSRDKVEALVFLYPRLTDPESFEDLLGTLKFASDRMAVRQRLGLGGS